MFEVFAHIIIMEHCLNKQETCKVIDLLVLIVWMHSWLSSTDVNNKLTAELLHVVKFYTGLSSVGVFKM